MNRVESLARDYWYELLIGALLIAALLELVLGRDASPMSIRYAVPLVALLVAPLLGRRRFPFAAPASYWLIATAISFVDGALIPFMVSLFPVGLVSAFLLGNQRDLKRAWAGLAIGNLQFVAPRDEVERVVVVGEALALGVEAGAHELVVVDEGVGDRLGVGVGHLQRGRQDGLLPELFAHLRTNDFDVPYTKIREEETVRNRSCYRRVYPRGAL